jgi:hypothetical protein
MHDYHLMLRPKLTFKHKQAFMRSYTNYMRHFVEPSLGHQISWRLTKESLLSLYPPMLDYRCK